MKQVGQNCFSLDRLQITIIKSRKPPTNILKCIGIILHRLLCLGSLNVVRSPLINFLEKAL